MNSIKFVFCMFLVTANQLVLSDSIDHNAPQREGMSSAQKVFICTVIGTGTVVAIVVAGPLILPAGAVLAAKSSIAAAAAKGAAVLVTAKSCAVAAAPTAGIAAAAISVGRIARPFVVFTAEERLTMLKKEESLKVFNARKELFDCLMKYGASDLANNVAIPTPCEPAAFTFEILENE